MPRKAIDYSNTIIYKLCCNNPNITDVYVGHTTDFTNRKRQHKQNCNNEKSYNFYVYQFIREHGDWTNWSMIEIEKICCIDANDARKNERRNLELLGATLNMVIPSRTQKETDKIYYDNNVEKEQIRHKIYYDNNVEKIKEQKKIYRDNNKEKKHELQKHIKLEREKLFDIDV